MKPTNEWRDILSNPMVTVAVFWLPTVALVASASLDIGQGWRTAIWTVVLTTMGAACVANALRCGRVHCYASGPFFLVMAIVTLLYGLGVAPLGRHGWSSITLTVLVGAIVLCCPPEAFLGKYRRWRGADR
jgi:hypothetical protein